MKITFIGHAGAIAHTRAGNILMDPWLFGSAFDRGWDLLAPSHNPPDLWSSIDYLWFSHSHPDHFHTASVLTVPREHRARIVTLYQATADRMVVKWLGTNGFQVRELPQRKDIALGKDVSLYLEDAGLYDSWLAIRDGEEVLLNLNDCAIVLSELRRIAKKIPRVDALMTQFSFASWPGNPSRPELAKDASETYLRRIENQTRVLRPAVTIPAASFIRFSHVENAWMNAYRSRPDQALERVAAAGARGVLLRPGDTWQMGAAWDNAESLRRYSALNEEGFPLHRHDSLAKAEVGKLAKIYSIRARAQNNTLILRVLRSVLGWLRPLDVFVTDHGEIVTIDPIAGTAEWRAGDRNEAAISCHSSALRLLLLRPWGLDTFIVVGRFEALGDNIIPLHNAFNVGNLNNAGIQLKLRALFSPSILAKLWRVALPWISWKRDQMRRAGDFHAQRDGRTGLGADAGDVPAGG